jgi:ribonuclease HI
MDVYTDGSYNKENGRASGAFLIVDKDEIIYDFSFITFDNGRKNVKGEIEAVLRAINYCKKHNINSINLYYDYSGIKEWLTGKWRIKDTLVYNFVKQVKDSNIKINFCKVKSHSGNRFNDVVDALCDDLTQEEVFS